LGDGVTVTPAAAERARDAHGRLSPGDPDLMSEDLDAWPYLAEHAAAARVRF